MDGVEEDFAIIRFHRRGGVGIFAGVEVQLERALQCRRDHDDATVVREDRAAHRRRGRVGDAIVFELGYRRQALAVDAEAVLARIAGVGRVVLAVQDVAGDRVRLRNRRHQEVRQVGRVGDLPRVIWTDRIGHFHQVRVGCRGLDGHGERLDVVILHEGLPARRRAARVRLAVRQEVDRVEMVRGRGIR